MGLKNKKKDSDFLLLRSFSMQKYLCTEKLRKCYGADKKKEGK